MAKKANSGVEQDIKLPKFLRLAKGAMWFDIDGEQSSGVKLYAFNHEFVGRGKIEDKKERAVDKYNNTNSLDFGIKDSQLPWFVDTTTIEQSKRSRIILAFAHGVLVECDPENPPIKEPLKQSKNYSLNKTGDLVFSGSNKEMHSKLQKLTFDQLRDFIMSSPLNVMARNNLMDLYDYEQRGFNSISRPRLEVLEVIKTKLNEYGPGISPIRVNEDEK